MRFHSLKYFKSKIPSKGFTLVELVVVLGIFALLTSVTLYKYRDFNNNIILTNVAYEVGLLVRQAQVYGLSVRGTGGANSSFDQGYGVLVAKEDNSFVLCSDTVSQNGEVQSDKICSEEDTAIESLKLPSGYAVTELGTKESASDQSYSDTDSLSIVFLRPDPNAYIVSQTGSIEDSLVEGRITISSPSGNKKTIKVWHTGQISVE